MPDRRFSLLERRKRPSDDEGKDRAPEPEGDDAAELEAATPLSRAIERDGEVQLDQSGSHRTHFCRQCEAETRAGATECYNCGAPIGGPGQAAFDALKRREAADSTLRSERERQRQAAIARAREQIASEREEAQTEALGRGARSGDSRARGTTPNARLALDPDLGHKVVIVCLFATVSAVLHLFLSAAFSADVPWSVLAEIAMAVIVTWIVLTLLRHRVP